MTHKEELEMESKFHKRTIELLGERMMDIRDNYEGEMKSAMKEMNYQKQRVKDIEGLLEKLS